MTSRKIGYPKSSRTATFKTHHGPLTYKQKTELPNREFAIPSERKYPINNESHARNALARVSAYGTPTEKKQVCLAVAKRYPNIHKMHCKMH